jgi:hypothetical protein
MSLKEPAYYSNASSLTSSQNVSRKGIFFNLNDINWADLFDPECFFLNHTIFMEIQAVTEIPNKSSLLHA